MKLKEQRCYNCGRLLYKGEAIRVQIKCPRCKTLVYHEILDLKTAIQKYARNKNEKG